MRSRGMYDYVAQASTKDLISDVLSRTPFWISKYSETYPGLAGLQFRNLVTFLDRKTIVTKDPLAQAANEKVRLRNAATRGGNRTDTRPSPSTTTSTRSNP